MRILITAALLLLAAAPCLAQPFTTSTVVVTLEGCSVTPKTLTVVPNGDEQRSFKVEHIGKNLWRTDDREPFDARGQWASLRLGGERTACETSHEGHDPGNPDHWVAVFKFQCTQQRFWRQLTVETKPTNVPMTYARVMPDTRPDIRCVDRRGKILGKAIMDDVAADSESIFVNLGRGELPQEYPDYSVAILRGAFGRHALRDRPLVVERNELLNELIFRKANSDHITPTISGAMRRFYSQQIGVLNNMTVTVK